MSQTRRLTAILAADVAGYSRLMGADDEGTHERLKAHLRRFRSWNLRRTLKNVMQRQSQWGGKVMRSSIIVAFVALGLITSASAQQIDQNTRQQIERIAAAYVENWNKHDAAGIAALYSKDGVLVTATGAVRGGPQEIEQAYQSAMKTFPQHNGQTVEQISPLGNDADIRIGEFHLSGQGENGPTKLDGRYTAVDVREGGHGKSVF
jgi:uncharacterized protein (TIGR02246 family)